MSAKKDDEGKLRYDLIPPGPLKELALVYTIGANKYGDHNYLEGGLRWGRVVRALKQHTEAWLEGEVFDPEDGQHHLASAAWCLFTLMLYQTQELGDDDRLIKVIEACKKKYAHAVSGGSGYKTSTQTAQQKTAKTTYAVSAGKRKVK